MWQWKTLRPAKSRNGISSSTRSPGLRLIVSRQPGSAAANAVAPPDLERPGVQMEHVVLGVDVGDLPELEVALPRHDRRELLLAVRGEERHRHAEAAADRDRARIDLRERRQSRRQSRCCSLRRRLHAEQRLGPRRLALRAAIVGLVHDRHRTCAVESEQQVEALRGRQQNVVDRPRRCEQMTVVRDDLERQAVGAREQQHARIAGVDQPQPDQRAAGAQLGPDLAIDEDEPAALAARPVRGAMRRRTAVGQGQVLEYQNPLFGRGQFRRRRQRVDHERSREAAPELSRKRAVAVRVVPEGPAIAGRHGQLIGEAAAGRHVDEHVVGIARGRRVQPVEVQVGRLVEPVAQAHPEPLALARAEQRTREEAIVGQEPHDLPGQLDRGR